MASEKVVIYEMLEKERARENKRALREKLRTANQAEMLRGGLRRTILSMVVGEKYENSQDEIDYFVESRRDIYPGFPDRVERLVKHANDLILAIQTKRNFPGLGTLSLSKQQELNEKVLAHFEELKQTLRSIERVEKEIKLADHRSTVWVVNVFVHALIIIFLAGFVLSVYSNGLSYSINVVFNSLVEDVASKIEHALGWR